MHTLTYAINICVDIYCRFNMLQVWIHTSQAPKVMVVQDDQHHYHETVGHNEGKEAQKHRLLRSRATQYSYKKYSSTVYMDESGSTNPFHT